MIIFYFSDSHGENRAVVSQRENSLPLNWLTWSSFPTLAVLVFYLLENFMILHKLLVLAKATEKHSFLWVSIAVCSSTGRCLLLSAPAENKAGENVARRSW